MEDYLSEFYTFEGGLTSTHGSILLKVRDKINQKIYILKKIICENEDRVKSIILEIKILKMLKGNKYTIQFEKEYKDGNTLYIITEFLHSYITIHEYVNDYEISVEDTSKIFDNLLDGIRSIHNLNIVHRDIKPDNIMIDPGTLEIKYIDFGLSDIPETFENTEYYLGTPEYINVKILSIKNIEEYTFNSLKICDLFSLGVLFYVVLTCNTFLHKYIRSVFMFGSVDFVYQEIEKYKKYSHFADSPNYQGYLRNFLIKYSKWKNDPKIIELNEYRKSKNIEPINFDNLMISDLQSVPKYG